MKAQQSTATMDGFILEPVKPSKAKSVKKTSEKRAVKSTDDISGLVLTWILFKRLVKFLWVNKVPITVNLFIVENVWVVVHHYHLIK